MAQPALIWSQKYEFPRLYSLDKLAQEEIFKLFNYEDDITFRGDVKLKTPIFENYSLPTLCTNPDTKNQMLKYCELEENLPDLFQIMHLMHLSEYPLDFNENIKGLIK